MSDCHVIAARQYQLTHVVASSYPISAAATLPRMEPDDALTRDRTPFGARLLAARQHAGLTQAALAEQTGLKQSGIAYLEAKGHGSEKTWQLAKACGVRTAWLAKGEDPMVGPESQEEALAVLASEKLPVYLDAPNAAQDYRTIAHTLAASLEALGMSVSIRQFLSLADDLYARFGRDKN